MLLPFKKTLLLGLIGWSMLVSHNSLQTADTNKASKKSSLKEWVNWGYSAVTFIPTLHANDYIGQGPETFHSMLEPFNPANTAPSITFGPDDEITGIYDGKQAPLYQSNIPRSPDHFKHLREHANLPADAQIGLHTLNHSFEQKYVWLKTSIQNDGYVTQYKYPTTDFTAPSLIDLIRAAFNIYNRDTANEGAVLVHCKAGKGRSGTVTITYYICIYQMGTKQYADGKPFTKTLTNTEIIEKLIRYGQKKREYIKINDNQKPALTTFFADLQKAGHIQTIYIQNQPAIIERETQLKQ
jgi:hypothetical protein